MIECRRQPCQHSRIDPLRNPEHAPVAEHDLDQPERSRASERILRRRGAAGGSSFALSTDRSSGATRTGTNPAAAVTAASSPPRICRRQRYSSLRQTSYRRATSATPRSATSPTSRTLLLARPGSTPANSGDDLHPLV